MKTQNTPAPPLPKPQQHLLVLPKGRERKVYVGQAFLGGAVTDATTIAGCRNVEALMNHPWVISRDELDWRDVRRED